MTEEIAHVNSISELRNRPLGIILTEVCLGELVVMEIEKNKKNIGYHKHQLILEDSIGNRLTSFTNQELEEISMGNTVEIRGRYNNGKDLFFIDGIRRYD